MERHQEVSRQGPKLRLLPVKPTTHPDLLPELQEGFYDFKMLAVLTFVEVLATIFFPSTTDIFTT